MRRLIIAALSALILLCTPILTPQGRGLYSSCWPTLMINLLRIGAPSATSPRLGAPPAQAPGSDRGAAASVMRVFRWNQASRSSESFPAANRIPTRSR